MQLRGSANGFCTQEACRSRATVQGDDSGAALLSVQTEWEVEANVPVDVI